MIVAFRDVFRKRNIQQFHLIDVAAAHFQVLFSKSHYSWCCAHTNTHTHVRASLPKTSYTINGKTRNKFKPRKKIFTYKHSVILFIFTSILDCELTDCCFFYTTVHFFFHLRRLDSKEMHLLLKLDLQIENTPVFREHSKRMSFTCETDVNKLRSLWMC